jgi:hypothetical protein
VSGLVGISASFHDFGDHAAVGVPRPLARAGLVPVILPRVPAVLDATLDALDGVVLAPGRDVDPRRHGSAAPSRGSQRRAAARFSSPAPDASLPRRWTPTG